MDPLTENTVNLLLQIPLAGVVVIVVVLFLRHLRETISAFQLAQEKQLTIFMGALKDQREEYLKAIKEVTDSLQELDKSIMEKLTEMEIAKTLSTSKRRIK